MEVVHFSGSPSFQTRLFLLIKIIPLGGKLSLLWKRFLSRRKSFIHSFLQKLFLLVEVINFNRIHSFNRKSFSLVKVILFNGRILNLVRQKNLFVNNLNLMNLILLEEVGKISSSYSKCVEVVFQWMLISSSIIRGSHAFLVGGGGVGKCGKAAI